MTAFPTRGVELIVPSNAELAITGGGWGINFSRRGHDYQVAYHPSGLAITCDGAKVRRWDDLPASIQAIITKSKGMITGLAAGAGPLQALVAEFGPDSGFTQAQLMAGLTVPAT